MPAIPIPQEPHPEERPERDIIVSAEALRTVLPYQAVGDVRYYLNAVKIEPLPAELTPGKRKDGVLLIATDGHRIAVFRDTHPDAYTNGEWICPIPDGLAKEVRKHRGGPEVVQFSGEECFGLGRKWTSDKRDAPTTRYFEPATEANYPQWRRVLPYDAEPATEKGFYCVNGDYLAEALQSLPQQSVGRRGRGCAIFPTMRRDDKGTPIEGPIVVRPLAYRDEFFVLIMPMRDDIGWDGKIPEWLPKPAAPREPKPAAEGAAPSSETDNG